MKSSGKKRSPAALLVIALLLAAFPAYGQDTPAFKAEELDQVLAPIALYPDALLSQVLMAATYPADVVEAARWIEANPDQKGDAAVSAVQSQPWDPSVQSLVAFPQVLATMAQDPGWVQDVGDAFLAQPEDVMDSVQRLRAAAQKAGNLASNEQQQIIIQEAPQTRETIIVIEPASPQVVYVPAYNPTVVYGHWWYPAYPPMYLPPPPGYVVGSALLSGIAFGVGVGITHALWGHCDWRHRRVDINVNHYNNIYVNKRINASRDRVNWQHRPDHRRGVPYRDAKSRERYTRQVAGAETRREYRGRNVDRSASRAKAQQAMTKRGIDPAKSREQLRQDPKTREQARAATRDMNRDRARPDTGKINRDRARPAGGNVDRGQARPAPQKADSGQVRQYDRSRGGNNAFKGASNPGRSREQVSRGSSSRQAMGSRGSGRNGGARKAR